MNTTKKHKNTPIEFFEDYWCYKTNRQKRRIKSGKEDLHDQYKLAYKQLNKLSKLTVKERENA